MVQGKEKKGREHIGERLTHTYIQKEKREKKKHFRSSVSINAIKQTQQGKKKPANSILSFLFLF